MGRGEALPPEGGCRAGTCCGRFGCGDRRGSGLRPQALRVRDGVDAARKRGEKSMAQRLANEMLEACEGKGSTIKKREDVHRMAEANRAFSHYRF